MPQAETGQAILVVDDDDIIRQLLAELLADFGSVEIASSGAEALDKAESMAPDLVILDVLMPDMDGYETCRRLKANEKTADIPIVFLTANKTIEDEEHALDIGAMDFIPKPISPKIVRARVSNILELRAAYRKLELLAATDPLTGAYNHRHFSEAGDAEVHRSQRYQSPFTVLMLDIDHFKAVNDTHGHGVGDEALKETVRVIQAELRDEDTLGRLGGEEFAIIFPQTDTAGAVLVAERIRAKISDIEIHTPSGPLHFTISIGVAEGTARDNGIADALGRADAALYTAKKQGRNRVVRAA